MNWSLGLVALVPPAVVTVTSTVPPADTCGDVTTIFVAVAEVTLGAAVEPKSTTGVEPLLRLVPLIVTVVPPAVGPEVGLTDVTWGAGGEM